MQNIYIIWETNTETHEEKFVNVCWNLKSAKEWCRWAIETYKGKYVYSIAKHWRALDSFGLREWKRGVIVTFDKVKLLPKK